MIPFLSFLQSHSPKNSFEQVQQTYHELRIYQEAAQLLAPVPYALRKRKLYQAARWFSIAYHPISFVLSLATAALLAMIFAGIDTTFWQQKTWTISTWFMLSVGGLCAVLLIMLFIGVEIAKSHYATELFKYQDDSSYVNKRQNKLYLLILVILSIVLSGVGGACVSYITSDKSEIYRTQLQIQKDSLTRRYEPQLKEINYHISQLLALQANTQLRRWGLTEQENKQLLRLQEEKAQLNKTYQQHLQDCQNKYQKAILANVDTTSNYVWITVIIVLLAEILNIRAYQIQYTYLHKVRAEGLCMGYIQTQESITKNTSITPSTIYSTKEINTNTTKSNKKTKKIPTNDIVLSEQQICTARKMLDMKMTTQKIARILKVKPTQIKRLKEQLESNT
ncbi:MAG: hypothetical protein NZ519_00350 [Bacteroidia bacterium]|nr:hypothetical protein [Bacteroidia bacterium]MDW8300826.1 hypothetical protein [Bacteroidia bacterium]